MSTNHDYDKLLEAFRKAPAIEGQSILDGTPIRVQTPQYAPMKIENYSPTSKIVDGHYDTTGQFHDRAESPLNERITDFPI